MLCALPVPAIPEADRCRVHDNDIAGFELGVTLYDANRERIYDNLIDGAIALFGLGIVSISGKDLKTPPCFDNFVYATPVLIGRLRTVAPTTRSSAACKSIRISFPVINPIGPFENHSF